MKITPIETMSLGTRTAEVCRVEHPNVTHYTMTGRDSAQPHIVALPPARLTCDAARDDAREFITSGSVRFKTIDFGGKQ